MNFTYNNKDKILHGKFYKFAIRFEKYHKFYVAHLFNFCQSIYFSTIYKMPVALIWGEEGG